MATVHPACVPVPTVGFACSEFPVVAHHATEPAGAGLAHWTLVLYFIESAEEACVEVCAFRRSDFMEAMYAFSFVLANFGIAIAAKMPMITTTMRSSISVKPLRFMATPPCRGIR